MPSRPVDLVGRDRELGVIDGQLDRLAEGSGGTILIVGEAGVGKTRLCEHARDVAARREFDLAVGSCQPFDVDRPLAALLDLFEVDSLTVERGPRRAMLEAGAPLHPDLDAAERVIELVERRAVERPLLLVLEDLHWADAGTLRCVRLLASRASADGFVLVATARPSLEPGPLAALVDEADRGRLRHATVERPAPLSDAEVADLVDSMDVDLTNDAEVREAVAAANGNPLLVMAVVRAHAAGPALAGSGYTDPIDRELRLLPPDVLPLVQIASLVRQGIDVELVATVAGRRAVDVLGAISALVDRGILFEGDDGLQFRHDVYRQAAAATLPAAGRAALHLEIARVLIERNGDELDICDHFVRGATPGDETAVRWLRDCARRLCRQAPGQALRLVDAAIALDRTNAVDLQFTRLEALSGVGRAQEAGELGRTLLHDTNDPPARARLHRELALVDFVQGDAAAASADMAAAVELLEGSEGQAKAVAERAFAALLSLDLEGATALAAQAAEVGSDADTMTAAHCVLTLGSLFHGDMDDAGAHAALVLEHAERPTAEEAHQYQPWFCTGLVAAETDDLDAAARLALRGREVAVDAGSSWAVPAYDALSAFVALRSGHLADAEAHSLAALDYSDEVDSFGIVVWCHSFLAQISVARGDVDAARGHVEAAEAILATGRTGFGLDHVAFARSMLQEIDGDAAAALATLRGTWDAFSAMSLDLPRQWMGPALVRLTMSLGEVDAAAEIVESLSNSAPCPHLAVARADALVARAWATQDAAAAVEAADLLRSTPRTLQRADALIAAAVLSRRAGGAAASGAPTLAAEAAAAYESVGATGLADVASQMTATGGRSGRRAVTGIESLTRSERRVLDVLATGLPNEQIAAQLHLSRRTVESHVSAAYRKLGLATRVELANAVRANEDGVAAGVD